MARETRQGRGSYFTTSRRVGRRVERTYFGIGPAADLAESIAGLEKLAVNKQAEWWRREEGRFAEMEKQLGAVVEKTNVLVRLTLLKNGFRKHPTKWRFTIMPCDSYQPVGKVLDAEQLTWALDKAEEGDPEALASVRRTMREPGMWEDAWRTAIEANQRMIATMTEADTILAVALNDQISELRSKWCGNSPTKLVRLLVERLALAWLMVLYAESFGKSVGRTVLTPRQIRDIEKRKRDALEQLRLAKKLLRLVQKDLPAAIERRDDRLERNGLRLAIFDPATANDGAE
jgi:hypothetical protein